MNLSQLICRLFFNHAENRVEHKNGRAYTHCWRCGYVSVGVQVHKVRRDRRVRAKEVKQPATILLLKKRGG